MTGSAIQLGTHFIIEGVGYSGVGAVLRAARQRGYTGSRTTLRRRLHNVVTWRELARNPSPAQAESGRRSQSRKSQDVELQNAIAATRARRAELAKQG